MTLDNDFEVKLSKNSNLCINEYADVRDFASKTCYSNTTWQLPLVITSSKYQGSRDYKSELTYKINEANNLVLEDVNEYKSSKREYVIADGKPISIKSFSKRGSEDYGEPYVLNITYEYFK